MRIACVPISENRGLLSQISCEFAVAPHFLLIDLETLAFRSVPNSVQRRKERGCDPCDALEDTPVDLVLADRIDPQAVVKLHARGVAVCAPARGTVADGLAALISGRVPTLRLWPIAHQAAAAAAEAAGASCGDAGVAELLAVRRPVD